MSQLRDIPVQEVERKRRSALAEFFARLVKEKPLGLLGGVIFSTLLLIGVFADLLSPYGKDEIHIFDRLAPISTQYLLGADQIGRDILSRLIHGARVSMIVGLSATTTTVLVAAIIGIPSGFVGGKFDILLQRLVDAWLAFPGLLVLITVMSIVGRGMLQIILVIGILSGIGWSRVVRSAVIGIKENDYFLAAEALGSTNAGMVKRHVIPNIIAPMIVVYSVSIGWAIMTEAGLSFLGFGLPPNVPSWGGMLSGEGRLYMEAKPQLALFPGFCLATVIYGVNMFGDAVRDLYDPRLRGG